MEWGISPWQDCNRLTRSRLCVRLRMWKCSRIGLLYSLSCWRRGMWRISSLTLDPVSPEAFLLWWCYAMLYVVASAMPSFGSAIGITSEVSLPVMIHSCLVEVVCCAMEVNWVLSWPWIAGGGGGAVAVTAGPGAAAAKEEAAAVKEEEKKVENFGHSLEWSHASFCTVNGWFCFGCVYSSWPTSCLFQ